MTMHKDYDKGFIWDKVLKELIKAGYAVRVYQNETGSVHISYFEM